MVNSVTAALAYSLLAALAVAEQMRIETEKRMEAQEKLEQAFEAMPVGLFTLDMYGNFLSANPALRKMLGTSVIIPGRSSWKQFFAEIFWIELHEKVHMQSEAEMQIASRDGSRRFMVSATLARGRQLQRICLAVTGRIRRGEFKYQASSRLKIVAS